GEGAQGCAPSVSGETPTTDICQVQVRVTNGHGTSVTGTILPPYEGPTLPSTPMGVTALPPGCGCEEMPAPTEFDYVPVPTVTSVSTSAGPGSYGDEFGGTVVTVTGTGFDPLTADWANLGDPTMDSSVLFCFAPNCLYLSGTEIQFLAPALIPPGGTPSVQPVALPFSVKSIAGQSNALNLTYAGVPTVTGVSSTTGVGGGPDTGGTPITITGAGFEQSVGPIVFADDATPFSVGTQYAYTVNSDTSISTQTVEQNPAAVDVEVCTVTGCSYNPPADIFLLYPPGNPKVTSISPKSGPAAGGTAVTIRGQNLGCVTAVFFGSVAAATFSNAQALLDCGSTSVVDVTAPPGVAGTKVKVTVTTVESDLTGSGPSTSSASFSYRKK
ncbi:MAG TPA: IPT/TIG domain-containing protein, partial [Acidimicrobiales bacterium]|nr:IPT/TIG domain-containing protein [Acidimicrobiales bacterium]